MLTQICSRGLSPLLPTLLVRGAVNFPCWLVRMSTPFRPNTKDAFWALATSDRTPAFEVWSCGTILATGGRRIVECPKGLQVFKSVLGGGKTPAEIQKASNAKRKRKGSL